MQAYPSYEEIEKATPEQILRWYRFLPGPGYSAGILSAVEFSARVQVEVKLLNAIQAKLKEFDSEGKIDSDLSKKVGWNLGSLE